MTLILTNNVTKKTYSYTVEDVDDSHLFSHFNDFKVESGMDDGQYSYILQDADDKQVASGVLQIGDYKNNPTTYKETNNGYKTYNG